MTLIDYLKKHNISIKEFSAKVCYTREYIGKIASGKLLPSLKLKGQIKKATKGEVTFD